MRWRGAAASGLAFVALATSAPAQAPALDPALNDVRTTLVTAKQSAAEAEARAAALNQAAEQASDEASRARARAAALGLEVQAAQADIAAAQARITLIAQLQAVERSRIADRQGPILHLIAALQTMARRPSALAVAQPGSLDDIVHVRLLLADTLPVIRSRTADLRAELDRQTALRGDAERALAALDASRTLLASRRQALAAVEATAIRRSQRLADQAEEEEERAIGLGEDARDIADRMQTLAEAGDVRSRLANLPGPDPRPDGTDDALPRRDGPARYRLPASGEVATGYGEVSQAGIRARGLTLSTDPNAAVQAPAVGTVVYAGPFRSYGRVVILAHGGGWTTTVTGLDSLAVKAGEHVGQGHVLGRAGTGTPQVTAELRRDNRPVDIVAMAQGG
jgi:septal ring factor EnvC (AmiA/AmiB activator)